jgi:folate-binding protein YgfZ
MAEQTAAIELTDLGTLRFTGVDAVKFLQGQLSNDVSRLTAERSLLAGYHNPQGRVIALLRLVQLAENDLLAIVPRELASSVASRLSKFVLRSKVKVADESTQWVLSGVMGACPAHPSSLIVRVDERVPRWLVISPADNANGTPTADRDTWRRLDIAAGLPQVYTATSEEFVAQMLNLDVLGAIAFDKGCYTGQEVIARAHYRGRVKRRLQRFVSRGESNLKPGDTGQLADGRSVRIVEAVKLGDGRCEFLAVGAFGAGVPADAASPGDAGISAGADTATLLIDAEQLPLPYSLPE